MDNEQRERITKQYLQKIDNFLKSLENVNIDLGDKEYPYRKAIKQAEQVKAGELDVVEDVFFQPDNELRNMLMLAPIVNGRFTS
jgi:hypothetical protein